MATVAIHKRKAWQIWKDVIFALFVREIRVGFNDKFGLSWAILEPFIFIFALSYLRSLIGGNETHTIPTFHFMAIGFLLFLGFQSAFQSAAASINKNKALFTFRQVQPISAVIASSLFELLVKIFVILCLFVVIHIFKLEFFMDDGLFFITCFLMLFVLAFSLGLIFGIAELYINELQKIRRLATRPLLFISCVFYSLQDIPREYWHYLDWNPILHAIELARTAARSTYGYDGVSFTYLSFTVFIIFFIALCFYYAFWKQAISR